MLSDLRESGSIEQDADVVMFIYRDDYYDKDTDLKNLAEVLIRKHRNGPTGDIQLFWKPEYMKFGDVEKRREIPV
jgi:replicative DNA helicase